MTETQRSLRRTQVFGFALIGLLGLAVIGWGAQAQIAGAVIARAAVAVKSNAKEVQHLEGGIVKRLHVENGDQVSAGHLLIELDDSQVRASFHIVESQLYELLAELARLEAERDGRQQLFLSALLAEGADDPEISRIITSQSRLLASRMEGFTSKKNQLSEQIAQLHNQIEGMGAQHSAANRKSKILRSELADLQPLADNGLVQKSRLFALEREAADAEGESAQLKSEIAKLKGRIIEIELKILQVQEDWSTATLDDLTETRTRVSAIQEQVTAARARLDRISIRAPRSGVVHELTVHTEGGVLAPGQPAMLIVPQDEEHVIRANVRPDDIDQISVGQSARIRVTAFNQRTMPELFGSVSVIGADLSVDDTTKGSFYLVEIEVSSEELAKLGGRRLKPGMPAEAFIHTEERTALGYVLKPLSEQISRAFRD